MHANGMCVLFFTVRAYERVGRGLSDDDFVVNGSVRMNSSQENERSNESGKEREEERRKCETCIERKTMN